MFSTVLFTRKVFILKVLLGAVLPLVAQREIRPLPLENLDRDSLNRMINVYKKENNCKKLGEIYGGIYTFYAESEHRDSATIYAIKSEEHSYKAGDSARYYFTQTKLGEFSTDARNFNLAKAYYQKAQNYYEATKNYKMLFHVYGGLAHLYEMQNDSLNSVRYESLAIEINKKGRDTLGEVILNDLKINKLIQNNKLDQSISLIKRNLYLINSASVLGNGEEVRTIRRRLDLNRLAECYIRKKDYVTAIQILKQPLPYYSQMTLYDLNIDRYRMLINSYININEKDSAIKYNEAFFKAAEKAVESISPEKLNEISAKYEAEKKQRQIAELQQQNHLQQLKVSTQRTVNVAFISIFIAIAIATYFIIKSIHQKRKMQIELEKQKARLAQKHAIEIERYRISSELHDDLGGGLSTIRLISEMAMHGNSGSDTEKQLNKISESSKELVQKMNEIVWALNINNDNLQSLVIYIRQFTARFLADVGIGSNIKIDNNIPDIPVNGNHRRNIFLIVKEALHNIVKHADATLVDLTITFDNFLCLTIHDNGPGISEEILRAKKGNGFITMQKRADELKGDFNICNKKGTLISFSIPLEHLSHESVIE